MSSSVVAEHPVLATARDITKSIASIREQLPFVTDTRVLGELMLGLVEGTAALDGLRAELVGQAAANGVPQSVGVRTMGQFVGSQCNASPAPTRRDATLQKWIRDFPTFADAYYSGQITTEHVTILKRLDDGPCAGELKGAQQLLVDAAIEVETFKAFETVCAYWKNHVDPDGKEPLDQLEQNAVRFRRGSGGRGKIVMDLDAISYAAAKKMIDHRGDRLQAENPNASPTNRPTASHDRFAGTMSLLVDGFARADGTMPIPLINIVMSANVADWAIGQLNGDPRTETVPVDAFDIDGRCELIDGTPVHPLLVAAVTSLWRVDAPTLRRYVLNAKGRIVDYSYNTRFHPEHLRTAAHIEHRGACSVAGCDAPHHWLQMDHTTPSSKGGPTSLPNTKPYCSADNQAKGDRDGFATRPPIKRPPRRGTGDDPDDTDDTDNADRG